MKRAGALLLALLVLGFAAPVRGAVEISNHGRPPAWLTGLERLRQIGVPEQILDGFLEDDESFSGVISYAEPAGDLDGDGGVDLFASLIKYTVTFETDPTGFFLTNITFEGKTTISALSGRTGETMWQKSYRSLTLPIPSTVGKPARPGALVISGVFSMLGPVERGTITFEALAGATGKRVWRRTYDSTALSSWTPYVYVTPNAILSLGLFDGMGNEAIDVVMTVGDLTVAEYVYAYRSSTVVIDGATGKEVHLDDSDLSVNWYGGPWATSDLDGDDLDDYVVTRSSGQIEARRGIDGSTIWTGSGFSFEEIAWIYPLPDVAGDRTEDLAVTTLNADFAFRSYLADGGDGEALWQRRGGWPYSPGDINGNGRSDVITRDAEDGRGSMSTLIWAHDGRGSRLWTQRHVLRFRKGPCPRSCSRSMFWGWWEIGDLQPDGLVDMAVRLGVEQEPGPDVTESYSVDARDGSKVLTGDENFFPLGAAVDGHGTDAADVRLSGDRIVAEARVGTTGRTLWKSEAGLSDRLPDRSFVWAVGAQLTGDDRAEVLVSIDAPRSSLLLAFDGWDGRLLWARPLRGPVRVRAD
jgi:hypothetical protein